MICFVHRNMYSKHARIPIPIQEYVTEVNLSLERLTGGEGHEATIEDRQTFLREARQIFGRTALLMNGAGALGMFHVVTCAISCLKKTLQNTWKCFPADFCPESILCTFFEPQNTHNISLRLSTQIFGRQESTASVSTTPYVVKLPSWLKSWSCLHSCIKTWQMIWDNHNSRAWGI